jgi:DNA topoisomerase-1
MDGKYGPYIKWEKVNATLPKGVEPGDVTMETAVALIAEKAAKSGKGKAKAKPKAKPKAKAKPKPKAKSS